MNAGDIMRSDPLKVDKDRSIEDAMHLMEKNNISRLLVTEEGKLVGIVTETDIAERLASGKERKLKTGHIHISSAMKKYLRVVSPSESVQVVAREMIDNGISSLIVSENASVVGLITKTDLVKTLVKSKKKVAGFYKRKPLICNPGDSLVHARKTMVDNNVHRLIVSEKGLLAGIITDRDMVKGLQTYRRSLDKIHHPKLKQMKVDQVMTSEPYTVRPETEVGKAISLMLEKNISSFPVVSKDWGVLTKTDIVRALADGRLP